MRGAVAGKCEYMGGRGDIGSLEGWEGESTLGTLHPEQCKWWWEGSGEGANDIRRVSRSQARDSCIAVGSNFSILITQQRQTWSQYWDYNTGVMRYMTEGKELPLRASMELIFYFIWERQLWSLVCAGCNGIKWNDTSWRRNKCHLTNSHWRLHIKRGRLGRGHFLVFWCQVWEYICFWNFCMYIL